MKDKRLGWSEPYGVEVVFCWRSYILSNIAIIRLKMCRTNNAEVWILEKVLLLFTLNGSRRPADRTYRPAMWSSTSVRTIFLLQHDLRITIQVLWKWIKHNQRREIWVLWEQFGEAGSGCDCSKETWGKSWKDGFTASLRRGLLFWSQQDTDPAVREPRSCRHIRAVLNYFLGVKPSPVILGPER